MLDVVVWFGPVGNKGSSRSSSPDSFLINEEPYANKDDNSNQDNDGDDHIVVQEHSNDYILSDAKRNCGTLRAALNGEDEFHVLAVGLGGERYVWSL